MFQFKSKLFKKKKRIFPYFLKYKNFVILLASPWTNTTKISSVYLCHLPLCDFLLSLLFLNYCDRMVFVGFVFTQEVVGLSWEAIESLDARVFFFFFLIWYCIYSMDRLFCWILGKILKELLSPIWKVQESDMLQTL